MSMDMDTFEIVVVPASFQRSNRGQIAGIVYLRFDARTFPEERWSDSVVTVISWWLEATIKLLRGAPEARVRFMDGPFAVGVVRADPTSFVLILEQAQETPIQAAIVSSGLLREAVLEATQETIDECRSRQWHSEDIDRLSSLKRMVEAMSV